MVVAIGPLSIDMYLPAMPVIQQEFAAKAADVQATMSVYLVGLAAGQVVYGPLSDAFGRKPPLLCGLAWYVMASVGCALAVDVQWLSGLRLLQALGASAGAVTVRAMIRDSHPPREVARALSLLTAVMGVAPIVAPLLGSVLFTHLGWRSIFWALAIFALAAVLTVAFGVRETRRNAPGHVSFGYLLRNYRRLTKHRRFMGYAIAGAVTQSGLFAYVSTAALIFSSGYGVAPANIGWLFAGTAAAYIAGAQLNRRLLRAIAPEVLMRWGMRCHLATATSMVLLCMTGWGGLTALMVTISATTAAMGLTSPNAVALALAPFRERAGMAASLMGTVQFSVAAATSFVPGQLGAASALPLAIALVAGGIVTQLTLKTLVRVRVRRPTITQ